jgi:hypothetical protein
MSVRCRACSRPRKAMRVTNTESNAALRTSRSAWLVTTVLAARMSAWSWLRATQNVDVVAISNCSVPIRQDSHELRCNQRSFAIFRRLGLRRLWPVKAWQFGAQAMVERLGDRWGLNTVSLSKRGSEVLERLCDVLVLKEDFSWHAEEICREIIRPQNPQSCPSQ